MIGSIILKW